MQAGDKLYIEFAGGQTVSLKWGADKISDTTVGYDKTLRPAYDEIGALSNSYDPTDYTAEQIKEIESILADTVAALGETEDSTAVIEEGQARIRAVKRGKDYKTITAEILATADKEKASNSLVEYAVGYGTATEFRKFPSFAGDQLQTSAEFACCYANASQLRATPAVGKTVLCFTAKEEAELVFDYTFEARGWSYESIIGVYASRDDVLLPLDEKTFPSTGGENRSIRFEFPYMPKSAIRYSLS